MELRDAIKGFIREWLNRDLDAPKNYQISGTTIGAAASTLEQEFLRII